MILCRNCKKCVAVVLNEKGNISAVLCEYEPLEFEQVIPKTECVDYEDLHGNDTEE